MKSADKISANIKKSVTYLFSTEKLKNSELSGELMSLNDDVTLVTEKASLEDMLNVLDNSQKRRIKSIIYRDFIDLELIKKIANNIRSKYE